jgi:hypothetical protein
MSRDPDYVLDISDLSDEQHGAPASGERRWVGIQFDCCGVYVRVYRRLDQREYTGRCPRCLRQVRLRVGEGGTSARFFRAD